MSKLGKLFYLFSGISLVSFAIFRFLAGSWIPFLWICLGLFVGFLVGAFWLDRAFYKEFFSMKTTKHGLSMGSTILLVIVLLSAVNFLAVRKHKTFDFSASQVNSLSEQSNKLVKSLSEELKVLYFYQKGAEGVEDNRRAFIELLKKYQDQSSFIKLEFVEMNERPDLTEKYEVTKGNGVVFLDYKSRKSQIQKIDEQEITSALVKVTREKDKTIYFTTGHGEKDLEDQRGVNGIGSLKTLLEGNRYKIKPLVLVSQAEVPADADLVVIIGPTQGFLDSEIKAIDNFLGKGGSLILALEPKANHNLNGFLASLGLEAKNNYIVSYVDTPIGRAVNPQATPGSEFSASNQVTKPFGKNQFTLFRLPMAIEKMQKTPEEINIESIVNMGDKTLAYANNDLKGDGVSAQGLSVVLSVKGTRNTKEFNAIVSGDSDFLANSLLYQNLNRDLVLNAVSSLVKEENLISITPKEVGVTQMQITQNQFYMFIFGFIIPLPILLLFIGGTFWYRRRNA